MSEPLEGFTVVEMTIAVQGPTAALYLRDMGANVIKVEPPLGDPSRYGRGRNNGTPEGTLGAQFIACNRGKESVCIDLATDLGIQAVHELVARADVFLSNYRAPALAKMGLDYASLHARHPNLVVATVNGFGPEGEDADKAMLDGAAVARGGLASMTGSADRPPCVPGAIIGDTAGGMQLALGVMTALLARERYGGGQHVQTSALGTQLWLQQWELAHTSITGAELTRDGSHHPVILGPYGIYQTSCGGAIMLAHTMEQENWDAFCVFAEEPQLAFDPRLLTPGQRLGEGLTPEDSEEIRTVLERGFARRTALEWDTFLRTQPEIIWERVRSWPEVLEDPQSEINDYFTEVNVDGVGPRRTVGNLVKLSETPGRPKGDAPVLGAHTRARLKSIGFDDEVIDGMEEHAAREREAAFALLLATKENQ